MALDCKEVVQMFIDVVNLIILGVTACLIWKYTKATVDLANETKKMVEVSRKELNGLSEQISSSNEQNRISSEMLRIQKKPIVNHLLDIHREEIDRYILNLTISNLASFEQYTKVCLDIFVDGIKIEYPTDSIKRAYQGELFWIIQPQSSYTGHFNFGYWFLEGCKSWKEAYPQGFSDLYREKLSGYAEIQQIYRDKTIEFKLRHNSISIYKEKYYSAMYVYRFSPNNLGVLIPQVCELEFDEYYDVDGSKKIEHDFTEIYSHL